MPKLAEQHKVFLVQRLACFDSPSQIVVALRETFGVEVDRRQIHDYDPEHRQVAAKWCTLHQETRAAFLAETASVGISHKVVRLRELDRMYRRAVEGARPNLVLAAALLEQAAKEAGDAYMNRRGSAAGFSIEDLIRDSEVDTVQHTLNVRFVRPGTTGGPEQPNAAEANHT